MKITFKSYVLVLGVVAISTVTNAQKKYETSAAVEYKNKYLPALASEDWETAKKSLLTAKEFIDLAASNEETKNSPKTLWLKGDIYSQFPMIGLRTMDTVFLKLAGENPYRTAIDAYKQSYTVSTKYHDDLTNSINMNVASLDQMGNMLFNAGQFNEAGEVYTYIYDFRGAISMTDSISMYYASICYEKGGDNLKAADGYYKLAQMGYKGPKHDRNLYASAAGAYANSGDITKAKTVIAEGKTKTPGDRELLTEQVNIHIEEGDNAAAEAALTEAINADPKNKQLHLTIGTIYIELKENEKAEQSIRKALEIDPNYVDAHYQLGAHLVSWAAEIKDEANNLKLGDPNYNVLIKKSDELYRAAIDPLEKFVASNPEDKRTLKEVYRSLSQIYRSTGDSEKSLEYKKKMEEL